jgi:hypothetical protein
MKINRKKRKRDAKALLLFFSHWYGYSWQAKVALAIGVEHTVISNALKPDAFYLSQTNFNKLKDAHADLNTFSRKRLPFRD